MAGKSIYPSIPSPGGTLESIIPSILALRHCLQMIIINAQEPNPSYNPSSAAQIFVTNKRLEQLGIKGAVPSQSPSVTSTATLETEIVTLKKQVAELQKQVARLSR